MFSEKEPFLTRHSVSLQWWAGKLAGRREPHGYPNSKTEPCITDGTPGSTLSDGFAGPSRHDVTSKHRRWPCPPCTATFLRPRLAASYRFSHFRADFVAGLTVATVAVPQAMAYALVAGVPPEYGLYTAIVMTAVGAIFDSSRQLINGPTNAISIAVLSAVAIIPPEDRLQAAILLAFLVGLLQVGITLAKLGDLTRYISHSVIVGFTLGASLLLVLDQLKNLLGLHSMGDVHDSFLARFWATMTHGGSPHWPTVQIGLGSIAMVVAKVVQDKNRAQAASRPAHYRGRHGRGQRPVGARSPGRQGCRENPGQAALPGVAQP